MSTRDATRPRHSTSLWLGCWVSILFIATLVRTYQLGRLCLWYDEVVTMRLARTASPSALLAKLDRIDATRAPLHPLLLQGWVRVFGPSEGSGRAFSVVCGVLTVALIALLATRFFDDPRTSRWAAWLAVLSPLLVLYSREARMYAWLVLATCAAWETLFSLGGKPAAWRIILYAAALEFLVYSHPLGLLMAAALALASLINRRALGLSWARWVLPHLLAALAVLPWLGHYFDHAPESTVGHLPLRFLLGVPIGFLGGNFLTLAGLCALIAYGLLTRVARDDGRVAIRLENRLAASCLLIWLTIPPVLLYTYSWLSHPIFGPARYTLFVAPAYLILVARGLAKLPVVPRWGIGLGISAISAAMLPSLDFAPDLKADWRAATAELDRRDPEGTEPVYVVSTDPDHNVEVETARYYLGPARPSFPAPSRPGERLATTAPRAWLAVGMRSGGFAATLPQLTFREPADTIDVPGLRLILIRP